VKLDELRGNLSFYLSDIGYYLFKIGMGKLRLTLVARSPEDPEMYVILTDDDLEEAIGLLQKEIENENCN
jgi:hypothetical protein